MVGFELKGHPGDFSLEDLLAELAQLASTAGLLVVGEITQRISTPNPATLIGSGKLQEIIALRARPVGRERDPLLCRAQPACSSARSKKPSKTTRSRSLTALRSILGYLRQARTHKRGRAAGRTGTVRVSPAAPDRPGRIWPAKRAAARRQVAPAAWACAAPARPSSRWTVARFGRRIAHLRRELEEMRAHRQRYRSGEKVRRLAPCRWSVILTPERARC